MPGTTDSFGVTGENARCFSALWLARRTSVLNLPAMLFCDCGNEFLFEVNHYGSQF